MSDWNRYFRSIRMAFEMGRGDVVEVCRLGGLEISSSRAGKWMRGKGRGETPPDPMAEAEFAAFCAGLVPWTRKEAEDDPAR